MLNLPPVHAYGTPQILSQWQAGQEKREREANRADIQKWKQKDFDFRQDQANKLDEQYGAEQKDKKAQRIYKINQDLNTMTESAFKHIAAGNIEFGLGQFKFALKNLKKAYPDADINFDMNLLNTAVEKKTLADGLKAGWNKTAQQFINEGKFNEAKVVIASNQKYFSDEDRKYLDDQMKEKEKAKEEKLKSTTDFEQKKKLKSIPQAVQPQLSKEERYIKDIQNPEIPIEERELKYGLLQSMMPKQDYYQKLDDGSYVQLKLTDKQKEQNPDAIPGIYHESKDKTTERPLLTEIQANGYVVSGRITANKLDNLEAMLKRAKEDGNPISVDELYAMEYRAAQNKKLALTSGSRLVIQKKQNIKTTYGLMRDMKATNEKLDYSKINFVSLTEQFLKGQIQDPLLSEFMTQRSDSLFALGNALKQNGLTDKSIEVEEEAAKPTLHSEAFNSWVNTQIRALNRVAKEMNSDFKFKIDLMEEFGKGGKGGKMYEDTSPRSHLYEPEKDNSNILDKPNVDTVQTADDYLKSIGM